MIKISQLLLKKENQDINLYYKILINDFFKIIKGR